MVMVIVLIIVIVIAIVSLFWTFSTEIFTSLTETGETQMTHITEVMSSCMRIEFASQNKINIKNCGTGIITNDSLHVFIDDKEFDYFMSPESITEGDIAIVTLSIWGISIGDHRLKIVSPKAELTRRIEAVLHDSAILALDFDEGAGNTASDKSGYGNDGTLLPVGSGPRWVDGKFDKALEFDGSNDYISVGVLPTMSEWTISAWAKANVGGSGKNILSNDHAGWDDAVLFGIRPEDSFAGGADNQWGVVHQDNNDERRTYVYDTDGMTTGIWYHVVAVSNGTHLTIYTNGVNKGSSAKNGNDLNFNEATTLIGNTPFITSRRFNGTMDSVRVYNEALTPDETVILKMK